MTRLQTLSIIAFATLALSFTSVATFAADDAKKEAPAAQKGPEILESPWTKRCNDKSKKDCEAFKVLQEKASKARVAEFAIGFPKDAKMKKGAARGAAILPLGILVEPGVGMSIDDGKMMTFKVAYCINAGCVAFVNLEKDVLETISKGKTVSFFVKSMSGQTVRLVMNTEGLADTLKSVE